VYAWTAADDSLSALMEGHFANFVKTGNPNGRGLPHWPAAYSDDSARVMILGVRPRAQSGRHEDAFRFLDRIYRAGGNRVSRRRCSSRRPQG
jgi:para-nitrobenzyl esterase